MFLYFYPVENDCGLERHTFDNMLDGTKEGTEKALLKLNECPGVKGYDLSKTSYSSRFINLSDLVTDYNDEELDGGFWCVSIPFTTEEMEKFIKEHYEQVS